MSIYSVKERLELVKEKQFKYEKEIQRLVESNLKTLLNLKFIKSGLLSVCFFFLN